jgi:hypothetical protein
MGDQRLNLNVHPRIPTAASADLMKKPPMVLIAHK